MTAQAAPTSRVNLAPLAIAAILGAALLWSYWTTLAAVALRWWEDPQYSHGWLVPAFAVYLLWLRREQISQRTLSGSWLGFVLLGLAVAMRLAGAHFGFPYFDQVSLLPCCAGLMLLAGGWPALRWSWPAVAFLAFMVPLPDVISFAMSAPMQSFATNVSTFALQVVGRPALAEGNVILLNDSELGIVEACSGLRMLVTFFALSTAVAMMIRKPLWEKVVIAVSAVPIALVSNVLRITITGICHDSFGSEVGAQVHEYAGLVMPVIGMTLLGIEWWVLKMLLIERGSDVVSQISLQRVAASPVAMYQSGQTKKREKAAAPTAEVEAPSEAEDAAAEPVAQG
jgi:exosortase